MIKRIFTIIARRLNTLLKFINLRVLKRKKALTSIEFLYLVLSKFQETKLFKLLVFLYKTVGIFLAFISFGVFYKENFNLNDINYLLVSIKHTIITLYNILYNTIIAIYNLIFKKEIINNENDETIQEPYDYFLDTNQLKYIFQEESTPWYQDGWIIGGILILLCCLGTVIYINWDSDSTTRENMDNLGTYIFHAMKLIKNKIINLFKFRINRRRDEDSNNESNNESNNDSIDELSPFTLPKPNPEISINSIDSRILTDPYMYPLFKNLNELEHWPKYGTEEHDALISKAINSKPSKLIYTYDHYDSLVNTMYNLAKNKKVVSTETANKAFKVLDKTQNEYSIWKNSEKLAEITPTQSNINTPEVTPKPSTSTLPNINQNNSELKRIGEDYYGSENRNVMDKLLKSKENSKDILTRIASPKENKVESIVNDINNSSTSQLSNESTFNSNLKGKFNTTKSIFGETLEGLKQDSTNLIAKTADFLTKASEIVSDDNLDQPLFNERAAEVSNINRIPSPPTPPTPPTTQSEDNSNPLLKSINNFSKKGLKKVNEQDLNVFSKTHVDPSKLKYLTGKVKEMNENEDNPLEIMDNLINTELDLKSVLDNPHLLQPGMSVDKYGKVHRMDNTNPLTEIKDLKSDIYERTLKASGLELQKDGTVIKIDSNRSSKIIDNNPLTQKLSEQLDKMNIFDDNKNDEIKIAPSFYDKVNKKKTNETSKTQQQNKFNDNEQNNELNKTKKTNWAGF
jgi:hypothetical protein